jgi:hypothetical protein
MRITPQSNSKIPHRFWWGAENKHFSIYIGSWEVKKTAPFSPAPPPESARITPTESRSSIQGSGSEALPNRP